MGSSSSMYYSPESKYKNEISPLSLVTLYVFLALIVYILAVYRRAQRRGEERGRSARNGRAANARTVLLVTAHPDDECMFFGPSILALNSDPNTNVHLLCLSNGNYDGLGEVREKELAMSCAILGIPQCNVTVLNDSELQDDPDVIWGEDLISKVVLRQIVKCDAEIVLTFDNSGVSSHANHIAAYRGVRKLVIEDQLPRGVRVFCLESISIVRKYFSMLEIPISFVLCAIRGHKVLVSSPHGVLRTLKAMWAHRSQLVWFRLLNMVFSRYFVINTIRTVSVRNDS